jgi:hypothetical protein
MNADLLWASVKRTNDIFRPAAYTTLTIYNKNVKAMAWTVIDFIPSHSRPMCHFL